MKALYDYFSVSTIHGLRYILPQNGPLMRIIWVIIVFTAFSLCLFMINASLEESLEHPISSAIQSVPASKFPFPTLSLFPERQNANLDEFREHILNALDVDCRQINESWREACWKHRHKLDDKFGKHLPEVAERIFRDVKETVARMFRFQAEETALLCDTTDKATTKLLQRFMDVSTVNYTYVIALEKGILQVVKDNFRTMAENAAKVKMDLEALASKLKLSKSSSSSKRCPSLVHSLRLVSFNALQTFAIIHRAHDNHLPLGSLLRFKTNKPFYKEEHYRDIDSLQIGNISVRSMFTYINTFTANGGTLCCVKEHFWNDEAYDMCGSCRNFEDFVKENSMRNRVYPSEAKKVMQLGLPTFGYDIAGETLQDLTRQAAQSLNFDQEVTRNGYRSDSPVVWLCTSEASIPVPCPRLTLTYSVTGYVVSMRNDKMKLDDDIYIYIFNPNDE